MTFYPPRQQVSASWWRHTRRHRKNASTTFSLESLEPRQLLAVVISEFMAANDTTIADEDGEFSDWIEIRNTGPATESLDGWYLTDDDADLTQWQFPNLTLSPGEHLLVFASNKNRRDLGSELHTNFKLGAGGEYLGLIRADGVTIAHEYAPEFPAQTDDVSYGLSANLATEGFFPTPTPGNANVGEPIADPSRSIVISEIMYHPSSENSLEEFIELHNRGLQAVNLHNWRFSDGVDFTFPNVSIAAGGYLAVAADPASFAAKYPGVSNVVGGWVGQLSNQSERIRLEDHGGVQVDEVEYADSGEWAIRMPETEDINGTIETGWTWLSLHDGGDDSGDNGKSLELINATMPNEYGRNWASSLPNQGTPGSANSVADTSTAPLIFDVAHNPPIPSSTDPVVVTARVVDETLDGLTGRVRYRTGTGAFQSVNMRDDGLAGDRTAGDGEYSATIPARPDGTVVEFYVEFTDNDGLTRTWPAPSTTGQNVNALYQVDDRFDLDAWSEGGLVSVYQVMTPTERDEFTDIERDSNVQKNATVVFVDGAGIEVVYSAGVRIRGSFSRQFTPPSNRINLPSDTPWEGYTAFNMNAPQLDNFDNNGVGYQNHLAGSALFRLAGLPAASGYAVRMYSNGVDLGGGLPYAYLEATDGDMTDNIFEGDGDGNLYRGRRSNESPPGGQNAGLEYLGPIAVPAPDPPDNPYASYVKLTNGSAADWSDVAELTFQLNNCSGTDTTFEQCRLGEYPENYVEQISTVVDIDKWLRTLALSELLDNEENGLLNGDTRGDDYMMYRGVEDPRFVLVPHDLDTLFRNPTDQFFEFDPVPALNRLVHHPDILPRYYGHMLDLIDNVVLTPLASTTLDELLRHVTSNAQIDSIKAFLQARSAYIKSQIPQDLTISVGLPIVGEFPQTSNNALILSGTTHAADTGSVLVNGYPATTLPGDGTWSFISTASPGGNNTIDLISPGDTWRYLDDGSDQGTAWRNVGFNDSLWSSGPAQLGYGDGDEATEVGFIDVDPITPGDQKNATTYFRRNFTIQDPAEVAGLTLRMVYDDGAAVYINGVEIVRTDNLPAGATFDTYATSTRTNEN
ncbi:MAG: lamin tail domain-containing protein, partial [Planctomycetales bacterium]|nr:lamin tail domain-containing protein [Planctomycetales bacterium]